ncbi:tyrosine-type recombinase/integrase [Sphingomicrobium sp. XHP0235]|uniref:tyrosine-type recombinase/integrase n=1 Tax=Sphingomicrobium aquimarinum TaxID=3133971 RepID=UPI0031FE6370
MANLYKRGEVWWARFKLNGHEYRRSLRTPVRAEAERRLKSWRREIERESYGEKTAKTWNDAMIQWSLRGCDVSPRTRERYITSIKQCREWLDGKRISQIDTSLLREMIGERRKQGVTVATIRRDLTAISSVLAFAMDEDWIEENPTLTVRHRRMKEKRDPIVLPDNASIEAVKAAAPPRFADAIEWARRSGMRQGEIFGLQHSNLKRSAIEIIGKGNKLRVIPYTPELQAIADRQPPYIGSPFVFWHGEGQRWASPESRFGKIRRVAQRRAQQEGQDFRPFRFHDLRHLYAVEFLRDRRGSIYELQQLLGHSSIRTTEVYLAHLTPEQKQAAMHGVAR